jgi:hypothetical protein
MIKIGIFYIPNNKFQKEIILLKSFFNKIVEKQKYLDHMVHSSIYVCELEEKYLDIVIKRFVDLKKNNSNFSLEITNWIIFENDPLTNLNTLALKINYSDELKMLQTNIVSALSKYSLKNKNFNLEKNYLKSYKQYGFPFVGNQWIPHITIGSLDINRKEILAMCEKRISFPRRLTLDNLGIFKIDEDDHTLIQKFKL